MASLADYRVLKDRSFTLNAEGTAVRTLTTDKIANVVGASYAHPILAFKVRPLESNVEIEIDINNKERISFNFREGDQDTLRVLHEVFRDGSLNKNDDNTVEFRVIEGRARFADAVIWFQQNV